MDIKHFYLEKGEGEPLIMLHGNDESCEYFVNQIDVFAERYHVYAVDTRGHGRTPRGEAPMSIRQFADDLACFMDEHEIKKAHILGFSDGGNIAIVFVLKYPEKVDRLILDGANLDVDGIEAGWKDRIVRAYERAMQQSDDVPGIVRKRELLNLMVNDPNVAPEELSAIEAKTLVIAGTEDMIDEDHTRLIADSIKGAELSIIPGDHFIANKNPGAFNAEVLRFLTEE